MFFFLALKRPRLSSDDCPLEESDSDHDDIKRIRQTSPLATQPPASLAPTPSPEPAISPDPDLDVEDDTESDAPENLSLKKPSSPETPTQQTQHPFMPYHHFPQFPSFQPQYPTQRSPVDVLLRVFPGRRRSDVEAILQRLVETSLKILFIVF